MDFDRLISYAKTTPDFAISYELIMTVEKAVASSKDNIRIIELVTARYPEDYFAEEVTEYDANGNAENVLIINMAHLDELTASNVLHRFHEMKFRKGVVFAFPKGMLMNVSAYHKNRFCFIDV